LAQYGGQVQSGDLSAWGPTLTRSGQRCSVGPTRSSTFGCRICFHDQYDALLRCASRSGQTFMSGEKIVKRRLLHPPVQMPSALFVLSSQY
jgi:hypothetical protein